MGRANKPYSRHDREVVLSHLADVLSIDQTQASDLIDRYADEIPALARVLLGAGTDNGRQWPSAILAKIPRNFCSIGDYSCVISKQAGGGRSSLKFLASTDNVDVEDVKNSPSAHAETYRAIHRGLYAEYGRRYKVSGREDASIGELLMSWFDAENAVNKEFSRHPWSSDTNLGQVLFFLENGLEWNVKVQFSDYKEFKNGGFNIASPRSVEFATYKVELDRYFGIFDSAVFKLNLSNLNSDALGIHDDWGLYELAKEIDEIPDSLLLLFGVHLSVNKALNEAVTQNEIHHSAFEMVNAFVGALNEVGITEAPEHILEHSFEDCEEALRDLILDWFGPRGTLLGRHSYFKKPLFESDIDNVLRWTMPLRDAYVNGRGAFEFGEPGRILQAAKSMPCFYSFHRFLLVVVLISAYYGGVSVDHEIMGAKNRGKAVFPARGTQRSGPSVHVEELLLAAFGQIFYSNSSFSLIAEDIFSYAEHRKNIRELKMLLFWRFVKDRSVREICMIFLVLRQSMLEEAGVDFCPLSP